jgi:hypothetical protein
MLSKSKSDDRSEPNQFMESGLVNLRQSMRQQIESIASQCQVQMQDSLDQIWAAAESDRASLAQRMVSDYLAIDGTGNLPSYHPLHWFKAQLEFRQQGLLDFNNYEAAQVGAQEILNQLQPEIMAVLAVQQAEIAEEFDRQIQDIRKSLATNIQPQLSDQKVIITEYINSYVTLPRLQLREVDKFGFFWQGKRVSLSTMIVSTTKTISPWYLLGLQEKQRPSYQISLSQFQPLVQESLERSFQDIKTQIESYINTELHQQIQSLLVSVS